MTSCVFTTSLSRRPTWQRLSVLLVCLVCVCKWCLKCGWWTGDWRRLLFTSWLEEEMGVISWRIPWCMAQGWSWRIYNERMTAQQMKNTGVKWPHADDDDDTCKLRTCWWWLMLLDNPDRSCFRRYSRGASLLCVLCCTWRGSEHVVKGTKRGSWTSACPLHGYRTRPTSSPLALL